MLNEDQLVKLLSVTVTDLLSEAGDLVEYHVLGVEHLPERDAVEVSFVVKDTTLPMLNPIYTATYRVSELDEWVGDTQKFLTNVEFRLAEALQVREGKE